MQGKSKGRGGAAINGGGTKKNCLQSREKGEAERKKQYAKAGPQARRHHLKKKHKAYNRMKREENVLRRGEEGSEDLKEPGNDMRGGRIKITIVGL